MSPFAATDAASVSSLSAANPTADPPKYRAQVPLVIRVLALRRRQREDGDPRYRETCRSEVCEVPPAEILWQDSEGASGNGMDSRACSS